VNAEPAQGLDGPCSVCGRIAGDHTLREWARCLGTTTTDLPYEAVPADAARIATDSMRMRFGMPDDWTIADNVIAKALVLDVHTGSVVLKLPGPAARVLRRHPRWDDRGSQGRVPRARRRDAQVRPADQGHRQRRLERRTEGCTMSAEPNRIDLARFGVDVAARELSCLLIAAVREAGGEIDLPSDWAADHEEILLSTPQQDGSIRLRLAPRVREDDERVPAGGWIHTLTGTAVRVDGITHEGLVLVRHQTGEANEHRADQTVDEFLSTHVRADAVPFIGDVA
jgi:hypothetical protein